MADRRRRRLLQLLTVVVSLPIFPQMASAEHYPSRVVRIVVGFPPGGPLDLVARVIAPWLEKRFGRAFAVENCVGASGNVATGMVAKAAADGDTLLLCGPVNAINTTLYAGELDFDFARDIAPVAGITRVPLVVEVNPSFAARSVPGLIACARSDPGQLKIGYAGNGTPQHIAIALFKMMSGVDMTLVAYPGSAAALADLLSGQVQVMFDPLPSSMPHIRAGRLFPLAVTSVERAAALPDVPVVSDFLPGYDAGSWFGISASRGTPDAIVDRLNEAINAGLADPGVASRLAELGAVPMPGTRHDFARFIDDETQKYRRVIRSTGLEVK